MAKKKESKRMQRLRWALRYIWCHPDCSPSIISEEWPIDVDYAIDLESRLLADAFLYLGVVKDENSNRINEMEEHIFEKMCELG